MDKKFPVDMSNQPPPYSSVPVHYGVGGSYLNSGPGEPAVPDVGFSKYDGETLNTGFMPPPMGFHVPIQPQPTEESNHNKEEFRDHLVDDPDMDRMNFSEKTIRMAFIRKVYSILMVQLLITTGIITLFCFHDGVKDWVQTNTSFMWTSYIVAIFLLFALTCCESVRRRSPSNIVLLVLFTISYAIVVGTISSFYKAESVVVAAGITVVVCLALTIFSFQTKWDFTTCGGMLFVGLIVLFVFGIVAICLRNTFPLIHLVYSAAGALLFSFYLVYDTQLMIGGNHKYSISPEEYIFAALNIYTDVILIFLKILSLLGSRN